jgi:hypothetical protein
MEINREEKNYYKSQVSYQFRNGIHRIINSYLEYLKDQNTPKDEYLSIEKVLMNLDIWLYQLMKQ